MARALSYVNCTIAEHWDIGKISVSQDGTGASNLVFRIELIYGKEETELDPFLDPNLNIHLFDNYIKSGSELLLEAKFGVFVQGLTNAYNNGRNITPDQINQFVTHGVSLWTTGTVANISMISVALEAINLATIAQDELATLGIVIHWPNTPITKE